MQKQRTLREKVSWSGLGLHSGRRTQLDLYPAPEDHGITFVRTDLPRHQELKASVDHLVETKLATTLGVGVNGSRAVVATVEHLLAALNGLGVDNARLHIDGPEVPVMDGSASPFVEKLVAAGIEEQRKAKKFLMIKKEVRVEGKEGSWARIVPGPKLQLTCSVDFEHPLIPTTPFRFDFNEKRFRTEVAPARTFGFLKDVEALRARGLARGGSLTNAIVIDHYRILNPEGLRFADEFVRHKALDAIGDIALFGLPVVGKLTLHRSGHALNTALVRAVLDDPRTYEVVSPVRQDSERGAIPRLEPVDGLA